MSGQERIIWTGPTLTGQRLGRMALTLISVSLALMAVVGVVGPLPPMAEFSPASPWPPWFIHFGVSPVLVSVVTWLTVVLGGVGLGTGLLAVARGWRPRVRLLMIGSFIAVTALMLVRPVANDDPLYYAAYGRITVLGHDPYVTAPEKFIPLRDPIRVAVSHYKDDPPSRYGPVATVTEAVASEFAGDSVARSIFWLKLWNALAFLGLMLAIDRLVRSDGARRARAHLMWSVNPLMLFAVMADGHNDVLPAAMAVTALVTLRRIDFRRGLFAGLLLGMAIGVKASFAIFFIGLAWAARGSVRALLALGLGVVAILVPAYLLAGQGAISASALGLASGEQPNLLWHDVSELWGWQDAVSRTNTLALIASGVFALLLLSRMPQGPRELPAVRTALALALALLVVSPLQRVSYDAMIFPLLAVMPASRLDWLAVARSTALGVASVPLFYPALHPPLVAVIERVSTDVCVPLVLAAVLVSLIWLCFTEDWHLRIKPEEVLPQSGLSRSSYASS